MGITLRPQQQDVVNSIYRHLQAGFLRLLVVLPTGAGKTVIFAHLLHEQQGVCCALAHRQELIVQMSLALAREGVYHSILPKSLIPVCVSEHMAELGKQFFRPNASCFVTSVKSILRKHESMRHLLKQCKLMVTDEGHHVVRPNEWFQAAELFPEGCIKLGFTATPTRSDGKGLGDYTDGIFQAIIEGPGLRWHIDNRYLCDYKVYAPLTQMEITEADVGATGDYSRPRLRMAAKKSKIVGDVVEHYKRLAPGKLGLTFATDIETAGNIVDNYNNAGVPAALLQANTPARERRKVFNQLTERQLLQVVNVDILGEGFDCPSVEVVSFARPTASLILYRQQFGRGLRTTPGKPYTIIIDHVGNVLRHGLPDRPIKWALDRRDKSNSNTDKMMIKICPACTQPFTRFLKVCPHCGHTPEPVKRSSPDQVDGDLTELTPEVISQLRGEIAKVDLPDDKYRAFLMQSGCPQAGIQRNVRIHAENNIGQLALRDTMQQWGGVAVHSGLSIPEAQRKFYLTFGIDVLSAQSLGAKDAALLEQQVYKDMMV